MPAHVLGRCNVYKVVFGMQQGGWDALDAVWGKLVEMGMGREGEMATCWIDELVVEWGDLNMRRREVRRCVEEAGKREYWVGMDEGSGTIGACMRVTYHLSSLSK